ncbi:uncharacterized protein ISCGN_024900 [Ixodes scapularis]
MPRCSAKYCRSHSFYKEPGVSFHAFPKDPGLRAKWLEAVGRGSDWQPKKWGQICSKHFRPEDFDRTSLVCVRLRERVVPSVFNQEWIEHVKPSPTDSCMDSCTAEGVDVPRSLQIEYAELPGSDRHLYTCIQKGIPGAGTSTKAGVETGITEQFRTHSDSHEGPPPSQDLSILMERKEKLEQWLRLKHSEKQRSSKPLRKRSKEVITT